ncbi:MAG: UDP-N-acetylmuramate--L-alanine ligase [Flavobacteriaceae bacterium]|nr:UDP-N-acetylmuramate--L-alanine ligase [Flavobacteriaceae bacterium]
MNIKEIHNVYFIGIGGIGMSALARYFHFIGKEVGGYDKTSSPLTRELEEMGMIIHYTDDVSEIKGRFRDAATTLVVYTPAVPKDHKELAYFNARDFKVKKRSEVLGAVTKESFCFAVAGTHGKTTTSTILAHLLKETGVPLMAFLGGISEDFHSNFILEGTEYSVVEADEYDRSFLRLTPDIACITSMEADHLDIYGDGDQLVQSFHEFAGRLKPGGKLFVRKGLAIDGITYGIEEDADYSIQNLKVSGGKYHFDIHGPESVFSGLTFALPGRHNLLNALVAFAMALQASTSGEKLGKALSSFKGVSRRFSYRIRREDLVFIDDYAHHPGEIDAVYQAVTEMHPAKRTVVVFQPHLFSRTRDFAEGFARSLSQFDCLLLLDIYPARELPIEGITSSWLLEQLDMEEKKLVKKEGLIEEIKKRQPEVLITMGAGDIGLEVAQIQKELEHEG